MASQPAKHGVDRLPVIATTNGETVYTSEGRAITISRRPGNTLPAGLIAEACSRNGIAQLWFTDGADFGLSGPGDHFGWDFQEGAAQSAWVHTFKKGTNLSVELVRPILDRQSPWYTAPDARALLNGLMLYRDLVGVTFHHSPAATSRELLISLHRGHKASLPLAEVAPPPPALDMNVETPISWIADVTSCRLMAPRKYLIAVDKNGAYLGAASNLALGAGTPQHLTHPNEADARLPGYFLITTPAELAPIPLLPPLKRKTGIHRWVTMPTLQFIAERYGKLPAIHEAYVWMEPHQPLQPWYKRLRDARAALLAGYQTPGNREALAAVKLSYSALLGGYLASRGTAGWDRKGDVLYRPDIRHMVIATARSNLIRTALACADAGVLPLALSGVDTLYFLSDTADPIYAVPSPVKLGQGLSQYKVKWTREVTGALRMVICDAAIPDSARIAAVSALGGAE